MPAMGMKDARGFHYRTFFGKSGTFLHQKAVSEKNPLYKAEI
jgi:hypothetical protein